MGNSSLSQADVPECGGGAHSQKLTYCLDNSLFGRPEVQAKELYVAKDSWSDVAQNYAGFTVIVNTIWSS